MNKAKIHFLLLMKVNKLLSLHLFFSLFSLSKVRHTLRTEEEINHRTTLNFYKLF